MDTPSEAATGSLIHTVSENADQIVGDSEVADLVPSLNHGDAGRDEAGNGHERPQHGSSVGLNLLRLLP
jgi:hypothetical protein